MREARRGTCGRPQGSSCTACLHFAWAACPHLVCLSTAFDLIGLIGDTNVQCGDLFAGAAGWHLRSSSRRNQHLPSKNQAHLNWHLAISHRSTWQLATRHNLPPIFHLLWVTSTWMLWGVIQSTQNDGNTHALKFTEHCSGIKTFGEWVADRFYKWWLRLRPVLLGVYLYIYPYLYDNVCVSVYVSVFVFCAKCVGDRLYRWWLRSVLLAVGSRPEAGASTGQPLSQEVSSTLCTIYKYRYKYRYIYRYTYKYWHI